MSLKLGLSQASWLVINRSVLKLTTLTWSKLLAASITPVDLVQSLWTAFDLPRRNVAMRVVLYLNEDSGRSDKQLCLTILSQQRFRQNLVFRFILTTTKKIVSVFRGLSKLVSWLVSTDSTQALPLDWDYIWASWVNEKGVSPSFTDASKSNWGSVVKLPEWVLTPEFLDPVRLGQRSLEIVLQSVSQ